MSYQTITNLKSDFQSFQLNLNSSLNSVKENFSSGEKPSSFAEMLSYHNDSIRRMTDEMQKTSEDSRIGQAENKNSSKTVKTDEKPQKVSESETYAEVEKILEEDSKPENILKENNNFSDKKTAKVDFKDLKKEEIRRSEKDEKKSAQIKKSQKDTVKIKNPDFDRIARLENDKTKNLAEENAKNLVEKEKSGNFKDENKKITEKNNDIIVKEKFFDIADGEKNIGNDFENFVKKVNTTEISDFKDFTKENQNEKKDFKDGKIVVKDFRTFAEKTENRENLRKSDLKISELEVSEDGKITLNMELNQNANADVLSLNNQTAASNGSDFQAMLNNQIQNNIPEFVKAGNIVLKDNDQGQINLVLHPDNLGNVKIHLSLDGKTISGNIIVTSKEALQVFKDNAETLREAFIKNGFDAANFEVAYNNSGSSANHDYNSDSVNNGNLLFAKKAYSNGDTVVMEENSDYLKSSENYSNYSVNIVA